MRGRLSGSLRVALDELVLGLRIQARRRLVQKQSSLSRVLGKQVVPFASWAEYSPEVSLVGGKDVYTVVTLGECDD